MIAENAMDLVSSTLIIVDDAFEGGLDMLGIFGILHNNVYELREFILYDQAWGFV